MRNLFFFLMLFFALLASCEKERFVTDRNAQLEFSADTVYFDTVFTSLATVTRRFTVKNNYAEIIRISSVRLAGGSNSVFRVNVDGSPGTEFNDVEIGPHDSMYVFVNATLDPNNSGGILLRHDSLVFTTNGNSQDVDIMAWGQDVHILRDSMLSTQVWTSEKPYLVIDAVGIDSLNTLTIQEGTKVYFHRNAAMYVFGSLKVEGTVENPVVFRNDRLEKEYQDIPGQWQYVLFAPGSRDNSVSHCLISGAISGIVMQTSFGLSAPVDLEISNSSIGHMSAFGIRAAASVISGHNLVISDCGISSLAFEVGGNYEFTHCTVANRPRYTGARETPAVYLTNFFRYIDQDNNEKAYINDLEALFRNSVIYGSIANELGAYRYRNQGQLNYLFDHCITKFDPGVHDLTNTAHFISVSNNTDPGFVSWDKHDFRPDSSSAMINKGSPAFGLLFPTDLSGNSRVEDGHPDLGAYEYRD